VQILEIRALARAAGLFPAAVFQQRVDLDDIGTQVGPERTRVRSSTVNRESACEARGKGIERPLFFGFSRW
jgi:hypothetical protein